ncbi:MAG: hypothetical protein HYU75_24470 [Betaproteobacteria bacterium]|nr:hypothetical protein [Betaproteobacteria bacterium]
MNTNLPRTNLCRECQRLVDASTMRPLSRDRLGRRVRNVCPECFKRIMALRKAAREARTT